MPDPFCTHCGNSLGELHQTAGTSSVCPHCGNPVVPASTPPTLNPYQQSAASLSELPPHRSKLLLIGLVASLFLLTIGWILNASGPQPSFHESDRIFMYIIACAFSVPLFAAVVAPIAAILAGLLALFRQPFGRTMARCTVALLFIFSLLFAAGQLLINTTDRLNQKPASSPLTNEDFAPAKADMQRLIEEQDKGHSGSGPNDFRFDTDKTATSPAEKFQQFVRTLMNEMLDIQTRHAEAMEADGYDVLLDHERLRNDEGFRDSRAMVSKLKANVEKHHQEGTDLRENFHHRLDEFFDNPKDHANSVAGFKAGIAKSKPDFDEIWNLEAQIIDHMSTIIDILESAGDEWGVQGDTIAFTHDEHLDAFNATMAKITKAEERQDEIRQNRRASINERLNK
jgi:hypothetical protein